MCSLYELSSTRSKLLKDLGLKEFSKKFTKSLIRPSTAALAITYKDTIIINWGLPVSWNKKLLINARYETLDKKRTFQPLLDNRCLIPATAYFEWRRVGEKKFRNRIEPLNKRIMTFAGLFSEERFIIVTCPSANIISHIHHRMPLIVRPNERKDWLDASCNPVEFAESLTTTAYQNLIANEEELTSKQAELFSDY